jgi:flavin-dependent dehydrogenase
VTVAATLGFADAAGRPWEAVVVGAGPAGALAARELARRGTSVLLVDKAPFPRWKVCGSCLNGSALATLGAVGLGDLTVRCGAVPLGEVRLAARGRQARVALPAGVALSRATFDTALVEAAVRSGADFLPGTFAELGAVRADGRTVRLRQGERRSEASACLVLAADGLGGSLLARVADFGAPAAKGSRVGAGVVADTAPAFYGAGTIFMACGTGGYVGLVRLEDGRLGVAAALDPEQVKRSGGPGRAAEVILAETGWPPVGGLARLAWRGTPALTRRASRFATDRLFVLGDAAGYVEPFTGEGMAWALAAAVSAAPLAARAARRWEPALADEWTRLYHEVITRRQYACRAATAVLRHPVLTGVVIAALAWVPGLATPFVRYLNAPSSRK